MGARISSMRIVSLQLFMCVLLNLQKEILLNDIETDRVFSNITSVYNANCEFWTDYMSAMLKHTRKTREPLNPTHLKDGFSKVVFSLLMYLHFILNLDYQH